MAKKMVVAVEKASQVADGEMSIRVPALRVVLVAAPGKVRVRVKAGNNLLLRTGPIEW